MMLCCFVQHGWCLGTIEERNTDDGFTLSGDGQVNFRVLYEVDGPHKLSDHVLELDGDSAYAWGPSAPWNSWVLLRRRTCDNLTRKDETETASLPEINDRCFVPASLWPQERSKLTAHGQGWLASVLAVQAAKHVSPSGTPSGKRKSPSKKRVADDGHVILQCDGETHSVSLTLSAFRTHCKLLGQAWREEHAPYEGGAFTKWMLAQLATCKGAEGAEAPEHQMSWYAFADRWMNLPHADRDHWLDAEPERARPVDAAQSTDSGSSVYTRQDRHKLKSKRGGVVGRRRESTGVPAAAVLESHKRSLRCSNGCMCR